MVMSAGSALAEQKHLARPDQTTVNSAPLMSAASQRQSVTVLVRDAKGNQLGSGVLMGSASGGYWVVTNRHVVQDQKDACVVTPDRRVSPAQVIFPGKEDHLTMLDIAFLWLPRSSKDPLMVATMALKPLDASQLPIVIATGYPTTLEHRDAPLYRERSGLLVPLLRKPLQGGFDLGYTAIVEKGMSGGGVFVGVNLIGINGAHANPLWQGTWLDQQGQFVDGKLNDKLELVSLGLSTQMIQAGLKLSLDSSNDNLKALAELECRALKGPQAASNTNTTTW